MSKHSRLPEFFKVCDGRVHCKQPGCKADYALDPTGSTGNLRKHMRTKHKNEWEPYEATRLAVTVFVSTDHGDSLPPSAKKPKVEHRCPKCDRMFLSRSGLESHRQLHQPGGLICVAPNCHKVFQSGGGLRKHQVTHTTQALICTVSGCGRIFTAKESLRAHVAIHNPERFVRCPICAKEFMHKASLKYHLPIHQPGGIRCDHPECGRSFASMLSLRDHMPVHLPGGIICPFPGCGSTFPGLGSLRSHISSHRSRTSESSPIQTILSSRVRSRALFEAEPAASVQLSTLVSFAAVANAAALANASAETTVPSAPAQDIIMKQEPEDAVAVSRCPDASDGDEEVHIVARIHTHKVTPSGVVYNQDGAKLHVGISELVPNQNGLFASEAISAGIWMTWYTGRNYDNYRSLTRTLAASPSASPYLLDVEASSLGCSRGRKILYYIDGAQPNAQFGGSSRCLATFANHSRNQPNSEFQVVPVKGIYRGCGVVLVATRAIAVDEEILIDYGDGYHQQLVSSGKLCDFAPITVEG
jgi:hypothetical protein